MRSKSSTALAAFLTFGLWAGSEALAANWLRAGLNTNQPIWGVEGGLRFAIPPAGFRSGEPRGLIRLGSPIRSGGCYDLVNFIAIEPVVKGRRGYSELEASAADHARGKHISVVPVSASANSPHESGAGMLNPLSNGAEQLEVKLSVERFENGAHVFLVASQRSDAPDEIQFTVHAEPDSVPMDYCVLTATMGNMARVRQLWLKDEMVQSRQLYPGFSGADFAPPNSFPLRRLFRSQAGEILVAVTSDEADPAAVHPFPHREFWYYGGPKVTQYWKKPAGCFHEDLHAIVNARATYWQSRQTIPGGVAFENFELRERFYDGQRFIFGITRKTPEELGLTLPAPHQK